MTADDEQVPDFLPSARRAMRMAVELASNRESDEFDRAYLWIAIAHELRIGASPAIPVPRPFERTSELLAEADLATAGLGQIPVPVERPPVATGVVSLDETSIIRYEPHGHGDATRCAHCGHVIRFARRSADHTDPEWYHDMTMQSVCPVSAPDQSHTFATPLVDSRG